jgi:hypothetical protein
MEELKSCPYCDDTGTVHRADGEWLGACTCPAGLKKRLTDGRAYCGRCDMGPSEAPTCQHGDQCGLRPRSCTCHPDDNPPHPCPRKFALSECRAASLVQGTEATAGGGATQGVIGIPAPPVVARVFIEVGQSPRFLLQPTAPVAVKQGMLREGWNDLVPAGVAPSGGGKP